MKSQLCYYNFVICYALEIIDFVYGAVNCRPRLLDFVSSLDEETVKSASRKAFEALPEVSKAVSELTVLKGVGPATASAVLAAYAPDVAPFMSDEVRHDRFSFTKLHSFEAFLC